MHDMPNAEEIINSFLPPAIRVFKVQRSIKSFSAYNHIDYRKYEYILPVTALKPNIAPHSYTFTSEMLDRVNNLLNFYNGTHNFHNFTVGKNFNEKSAWRYMKSISVHELNDYRVLFIN